MKELKPPRIAQVAEYEVKENEILMCFVNDKDAELFFEWWESEGFKDFKSWVWRNDKNL